MRRALITVFAVLAALSVAFAAVSAVIFFNRERLGLAPAPVAAPSADPGLVDGPPPATIEDPDLGTMDVYDVLTDGSLSPSASGIAAEVWDAFTRVATRDFTAEVILTYQVGDSADSDLLAWVVQDEDHPEYWHLAVNLSGAVDPDGELATSYLLTTLIHEFAHILTLDESQISATPTCELEFESQDCWYDDAYLLAFWEEFWAGYGDEAPSSANEDSDVHEAFYAAHEDDFVTSYAAKNVVEDIAECFMAYVIEDVPDPSQSLIAAKLAFFDRYPELTAIRERIRAEFGEVLQPVWDA